MRKQAICICETEDGYNREAGQRLCFRYMDSILPLLLISEIQAS